MWAEFFWLVFEVGEFFGCLFVEDSFDHALEGAVFCHFEAAFGLEIVEEGYWEKGVLKDSSVK